MERLSKLEKQINEMLNRQFRGRLLERGLSRSMIWQDGELPEGAPHFSDSLSYDLLSYGFGLLSLAIQYKELNGENKTLLNRAFERAGDAVTYVIDNGDPENYEKGFHRIIASASYHLAYYSAKAYSLLHEHLKSEDCIAIESILAKIILRDFSGLEKEVTGWKLKNLQGLDQKINDYQFDEEISEKELADFILDTAIDDSYYSALFQFLVAYECADVSLVNDSWNLLNNALSVCGDHGLVRQWWIIRLSKHLLMKLWNSSFHVILPMNSPSGVDREWQNMRWQFITSLMMRDKAEIDLWPSQIEGAKRAVNDNDSIVVSLPTSAGKTRVAELAILRCLSINKRVIFITPLRALSAQTEISLRKTFSPLGKKVSSLYGNIGISNLEQDVMRTSDIVVGTPEKLDFALRNDSSLLNDVGLIVLDEGHMIGLGSREISYEVQIQRLLRRSDANQRRIICLSAILPDGDQFEDFVNWLQKDSPSKPIQSNWRPTELRFGTINWYKTYSGKVSSGEKHGYARINFTVEGQEAFIPRFLESYIPPIGRRQLPFPEDRAELTIASAFKLIEDGHTVLIYCTQKDSVNSLAKKIVDLDSRGALTPKINIDESKIALAIALGKEWLGEEHEIIECLKIGVAVHHGSLPTPFRKEIERLLREGVLRITISSPTLAQGLNLSATAIIMYSLTRYDSSVERQRVIDISEFKNVIGRAGRAYVDTHGLVLYPIWDKKNLLYGDHWQDETLVWKNLINSTQARDMESGLFQLLIQLVVLSRNHFNVNDMSQFKEYLCNNSDSLPIYNLTELNTENKIREDRQKYLSLLDTTLLSMLGEDENIEQENISNSLENMMHDSLLDRRLKRQTQEWQKFVKQALEIRANYIWENSTVQQRKGYFFAGVGFDTGKKLDSVANEVNKLLLESNEHIANQNNDKAIDSILELARIIFTIDSFIPKKLPGDWEEILKVWLQGKNIQEEDFQDLEDALEFIEDGLVYRLPWGLEAIKVRAIANSEISAEIGDQLDLVVPAIENGTLNRQAAILIQAGFNSRLAAILAVESTQASFDNLTGLRDWLVSPKVRFLSDYLSWPTPETNKLWKDFCEHEALNLQKQWRSEQKTFSIDIAPLTNLSEQTVKLVQSGNEIAILNTRGDVLSFWKINWGLDSNGIYVARLRTNQLAVIYYGFSDQPFPI